MPSFKSKSEVVAEEIRELIERGDFEPGLVLRQRTLAERFGVSPTPVREALQRLEAEGYVTSELHRGATVVRPEDARVVENFLIREALEGLATELAARRITAEQLAELEQINDEMVNCGPNDPRRFQLNRTFHFGVYEAANSPVLTSMLTLLWRSLREEPGMGRPPQEAHQQHARIIECLRDGDAEGAAKATRHHIEDGSRYEAHHAARQADESAMA